MERYRGVAVEKWRGEGGKRGVEVSGERLRGTVRLSERVTIELEDDESAM